MPPGVPFPQFATALTDGTDKPDLHFRSGIAIIPRLALPSSGERAALARRKRGAFVRKRAKGLNPKIFLAKVGEGKTISKYRKDQIVFSQGEVADAVFYIQQGKIKLTVVSEQGKEAV